MRRIRLFDTTLRDGDQAAGFAFPAEKKLSLARALADAGVDIIETGFPLSSPAEFEVCRRIALELSGPLTAVMCRGRLKDIEETAKVFEGGIPGVLHISLPVSKIHIAVKLGMTEKELLRLAVEAVSFASGLVPAVELGAEDASRADPAFLLDYCAAALEAGAGIINMADTLGICSPLQIADLAALLQRKIPPLASGEAVLSVHCHNDFGLACANTLAAIAAGCRQAEVSVSGIGERAGNAALEEVAANLLVHPELYHARTGIHPQKLAPLALLAAESSGTAGSPIKPLSGWNIRSHSSGIHQQGLSKRTETYSLPVMEDLTLSPERIVLSRHSGQSGVALFARLYCGLELEGETLARVTGLVKAAPGTATGITEFICILADLRALPAAYRGPLRWVSFSETADAVRYRIRASLRRYKEGAPSGKSYPLRGEGNTLAGAALGAVSAFTGIPLRLRRLAVNGTGELFRLYAEISAPGTGLYAVERTGAVPGLLLLECCLDAVNGMELASAYHSPGLKLSGTSIFIIL
jgi:2-isopropylmalate synthase